MFSVPRPATVNKVARARLKVVVIGDRAVGKSSLVSRYVHNTFTNTYVRTLGTKIYRKPVGFTLPDHRLDVKVNMTIWDVMGDRGLEKVLKDVYFHGSHGILAVCDASREETLHGLAEWIDGAYSVAPNIPVHVVANKWDVRERVLDYDDLEHHAKAKGLPHLPASARTGANVQEAFHGLAASLVRHRLQLMGKRPVQRPTLKEPPLPPSPFDFEDTDSQ